VATTAIVEDANGNGAAVTATPAAGSSDVTVTAGGTVPPLQAPVRILWDLIGVSRGKTVRNEALGLGDATRAGQDFTLSNAPVTYLAGAPGRSGDGYSSTVVLTVDGRYWTEVPMLFGHGPDEPVFETYEDDAGKTHVRTGTGETGRRLPSGAKVSATYRVGSGAAVPAAGALSQVLTAVPNLRSVRNPVPPVGGADPEPAADVRTLAPRSVLTFGRAISGDDYATVAAAAPGVTRASAAWEWDAAEQRPTVRVYVGDDAGALASAKTALAAQADPNRPLVVVPAVPCRARLRITLRLDPSYVAATVDAAVNAALVGGLFAPGVLALGEPLYRSRIEEIVCAIPGVLATHHMRLVWTRGWLWHVSSGPCFNPGAGGFFTLTAADLSLSEEVDADD
jgi:predicted phage baseplate assembly protein